MKRNISLICMSQGNVNVLRKTFESFKDVCNEIVYGDMCLFSQDSEQVESYKRDFNLRILKMPFDYIFHNGFASTLNYLISHASNDLCLYMNCSEIISVDHGINKIVNDNPECNTFYFDHPSESHRWYRMNDRRFLKWSGFIHEESTGNGIPYHKKIFTMEDLPKDQNNKFKAKVFDDSKEVNYFANYMRLVENPNEIGATNAGWLKFAKENYESMLSRSLSKGARYEAFKEGDLEKYLHDVWNNPEFEKERFESNIGIEYQSVPKKYLL